MEMKLYFEIITMMLARRIGFIYEWLAKSFFIKGAVVVPLGLILTMLYLHKLPTPSELVPWAALAVYMLLMSLGFKFYGQLIAREVR